MGNLNVGDAVKIVGGKKAPIGTIGIVKRTGDHAQFGAYAVVKWSDGEEVISRKHLQLQYAERQFDPQSVLTGLIDCEPLNLIIIPSGNTATDPRFTDIVKRLEAKASDDGLKWLIPIREFEKAEAELKTFKQSQVFIRRKALYYQKVRDVERERIAVSSRKYDELIAALGGVEQPFGSTQDLKPRYAYGYQQEGIKWLLKTATSHTSNGGILADDMGLGKTLQATAAARAYLNHSKALIRVICPASVRSDWYREIHKQGLRVWNSGLFGEVEVMSWGKISEHRIDRPFILICDESQNLSNPKSKRTLAVLREAENPMCLAVWHLSGTPFRNAQPINVWAMLKSIRHPVAFNVSAIDFQKQYKSSDAGMLRLNELTKGVYLRRMKRDCLKELPKFTRIGRKVELSPESREIYRSTYKRLQEEYHKKSIGGNADGIVKLLHLRYASSLAKIEDTVDVCQRLIEQGQHPIVFVAFVETAKKIAQALGGKCFTGEFSRTERDDIKADFIGGNIPALCITYGAGGTGVDGLQHVSSTCVMHDRPLVPCDISQAESRVDRNGQTEPVTSIWMQANLSVDEKLDALIQRKHNRSEKGLTGSGASIELDSESFSSDENLEAELAKTVEFDL